MRAKIALVAPWLAAAAIGGAVALAPLANADSDSKLWYDGNSGPNASAVHRDPTDFGWHSDNHDDDNGTAGSVDVPF